MLIGMVVVYLKLFSFIALLNTSVAAELDGHINLIIKEKMKFNQLHFKIGRLNHMVIPLVFNHYFEEKEILSQLGTLYRRENGNLKSYLFFSLEYEIAKKCFEKNYLPYAINTYCSIKSLSDYDLGRLVSLIYLIGASFKEFRYIPPIQGLADSQKDLQSRFQEILETQKMLPITPCQEGLKYISKILKISYEDLESFWGDTN